MPAGPAAGMPVCDVVPEGARRAPVPAVAAPKPVEQGPPASAEQPIAQPA